MDGGWGGGSNREKRDSLGFHKEVLEDVTWKIDAVPKSEKSSPWAPAAPMLDDVGDLLRCIFHQIS